MGVKNVLIPRDLLIQIAELLTYWDTGTYDDFIQQSHINVMDEILNKLQALELRKAYSKIVCAKADDDRFFARMEYLKLRHKV